MIKLECIKVQDKRVDYIYSISEDIQKYFTSNSFFVEYEIEMSNIPQSILVIPFLGNFLPISWFVGFDIQVTELDYVFHQQVLELKKEFSTYYDAIDIGKSKLLIDSEPLNNSLKLNNKPFKSAMLYSGGIDAYATYFRHFEENLDLITIHGADIGVNDYKQWNLFLEYNENQKITINNSKYYIRSNVKEFYSYKVNNLLKSSSWWGKVQHGFSLSSLVAPLAYLNNYSYIYSILIY
ncbi:MAG: hypothetical protein LUH22_13440 [Bacteroides sp.]|nr:hypothetical protein [Bacteroides sp.]